MTIERLTSEAVPVDDFSGIPDLVEVVNLQDTGPTEAARAIRKKLKYGNLHRQLRALNILDGLIQNAGPRFQRSFADEALLERLRFCGTAALSDPEVRKKCKELFAGWAAEYKNTPGMGQVANLYKVGCISPRRRRSDGLTPPRNSLGASKPSRKNGPKSSGRQKTRLARRKMTTTSPAPEARLDRIPERHPSPTSSLSTASADRQQPAPTRARKRRTRRARSPGRSTSKPKRSK